MKEYDKYVVWLEYFNSELKRSEGRRVPLNSATRAPTMAELSEACRRLKVEHLEQLARYPVSSERESGYVAVTKQKPKQAMIQKIAKELIVVRGIGQRRQGQAKSGRKK